MWALRGKACAQYIFLMDKSKVWGYLIAEEQYCKDGSTVTETDDFPPPMAHCGKLTLRGQGRKRNKIEKRHKKFIVGKARSVQGKSDKNCMLHILMRQIGQDMVEHPKTGQSLVCACLHMRQTGDRWWKGKGHKLEENMGIKELGKQQHKADTPGLGNTERQG